MDKSYLLKTISTDESRRDSVNNIIRKIKERIERIIKENSWNAEFFLGGSVAKGTDLNESDIDIFILFKEDFKPITVVGILKRYFPDATEEYSEHPYIKVKEDGIDVDIVPAYFIEEGKKIKTSVDRTPLHVKFIIENLNESEKNEARILKFFLKKLGIYGAESSIRGFSGYAAELLIYKFHTFDEVLLFFKNQKPPIKLTVRDDYVDFSKFREPCILIDPVDPERNVTANLSEENLNIFILASRLFSWNNAEKFFFPDKRKFEVPENSIGIKIRCHRCNEDTVISNLRRIASSIQKNASIFGFEIRYFSIFLKDGYGFMIFLVNSLSMGRSFVHTGPSIYSKNIEDFLYRWKNYERYGTPFVMQDRIYIITDRKFSNFEDFLMWEIERNHFARDFDKRSIEIIKKEKIENLFSEGIIEKNLYFLI